MPEVTRNLVFIIDDHGLGLTADDFELLRDYCIICVERCNRMKLVSK